MVIRYNIEKIEQFLYDFYNITGTIVSIWDTEMNRIGIQPNQHTDYCRLVKSTPEGERRCQISDRQACIECRNTLSPISYLCHAGIVDTAIPIVYQGKLFGYVMFGQVQGKGDSAKSMSDMERLGHELGVSPEALFEAHNQLNFFDQDKVDSAARILFAATDYLFASASIEYTEDELIDHLNRHIRENMAQPLAVPDVCTVLGVSQKQLYALCRRHFDMTIGQYILQKRMEAARDLLLGSEEKIRRICVQVGIPDYNYFSKVFKRFYGASPKDYRRMHEKS